MRKPRTFTWRERIQMMDSKAALQEVETVLQEAENFLHETRAKLKETEKLEENVAKQS